MNTPPPFHAPSIPTMSRNFVPSIPNHMNSFGCTGNSVTTNVLYHEQQIQNGTFNNRSAPYNLYMPNPVPSPSIRDLNPEVFNWHTIDAQVGAELTDNQRYSSQMRNSNNISDVEDLVMMWSAQNHRFLQSGFPTDPVLEFISDIPGINNRNPALFNAAEDDIKAGYHIHNYSQCDPPVKTFNELNEWFDRQQAGEEIMDIEMCVSSETAMEPFMPNQYVPSELVYHPVSPSQPIPSPTWNLGRTEVTHPKPGSQIRLPIESDFDLLKNEKSSENSETTASPPPPPPPRPPPSNRIDPFIYENGKRRRVLLHEFLRRLLDSPNFSHIAQYTDKRRGIFKIIEKEQAAELWETAKGRNTETRMTYQNFARGIRYYYKLGIIRKIRGHFTFRFGAVSGFGTTWVPAY